MAAVQRGMAVAAFLALCAAGGACKGKASDGSSEDAAVVEPRRDAGPPDAMIGDAGAIDDSAQLPGSGHVVGGTVEMDVEIGNAIEPAVLRGGTYTLEISGDVAPQP